MKVLPPPPVLLRELLHDPRTITVAAFAVAAIFLGIALGLIFRNLHHNDHGLRAPLALPLAVLISAAGVFGAGRLPAPWSLIIGTSICGVSRLLSYDADHRRFVRDPAGKTVADRRQIVLAFAGLRWTRDKANRHFSFSGDTGSGKTSGMNGRLTSSGNNSGGRVMGRAPPPSFSWTPTGRLTEEFERVVVVRGQRDIGAGLFSHYRDGVGVSLQRHPEQIPGRRYCCGRNEAWRRT